MVLLTSSTVSVIISTAVICTFTFLLFLSGYVLQQQSVRSIQHAIRPPPPPPPPAAVPVGAYQGAGQEVFSDSLADKQHKRDDAGSTQATTGNFAYLQLLSTPDPSDICSAILFFKHLATNGTAVQDRLFMYPREWDLMPTKELTEPVATALSLLRTASLEYGIWLLPIDMTLATSEGYKPTDTKLLRLGQIQFMQYDSVLYVQTPGLLLDTAKLDAMLLSRPLPLRHDKNRIESFNNEAWLPMPLRAERDSALPPVYLITVNSVENGHIEARGHVPNTDIPGFSNLVTGPDGVLSANKDEFNPDEQPGYVYFEQDDDGHVKWAHNPLFGSWRVGQHEVCEGLDLDDAVHDGYDL